MKHNNKICDLLSVIPTENEINKKEGFYTRIGFEYKNVEDNQDNFNHSLIKELSSVLNKYFTLKDIDFTLECLGYNIKNKK